MAYDNWRPSQSLLDSMDGIYHYAMNNKSARVCSLRRWRRKQQQKKKEQKPTVREGIDDGENASVVL